MKNQFKEIQAEVDRQLKEREGKVLTPKEHRSDGRKLGGLLLFLSILMWGFQAGAYFVDDTYWKRLVAFTLVLSLTSLFMIITGWMPKDRFKK